MATGSAAEAHGRRERDLGHHVPLAPPAKHAAQLLQRCSAKAPWDKSPPLLILSGGPVSAAKRRAVSSELFPDTLPLRPGALCPLCARLATPRNTLPTSGFNDSSESGTKWVRLQSSSILYLLSKVLLAQEFPLLKYFFCSFPSLLSFLNL